MYRDIFKYQIWHFLAAFVAVILLFFLLQSDPSLRKGTLFGIETVFWFWMAVITSIVHQLYVFFVWRFELYKQLFSKKFGTKKAFKLYSIGFSILFVFRLVFIIFLACSNEKSLELDPLVAYSLAAIITPFVVYLFYSVKRYFTIERAYGIDHFDRNYNHPFVKKGIFKYTNNGMYVVGLAVLYLPGLLLLSKAALVVALFNHLYIWVHYYTVERPDMEYIYGKTP